jgi:allantoate deiminase
VAGLAAVHFLAHRFGRPRKTLEVIAFSGEEGTRFPVCFLGSRWMTGTLSPEALLLPDSAGVSLAEALAERGFPGLTPPETGREDLDAFLELHIEQGPVLEAAGQDLGLVSTIMGQGEAEVTLRGRADHAGTAPMNMRRDALVTAARLITSMHDEIADLGGATVFTVGRLGVKPGSGNVVPSEVTFSIDCRDPNRSSYRRIWKRLRDMCREAATPGHVEVAWRELFSTDPVACDPGLLGTMRGAARRLGYRSMTLPSGAGHDSMVLARKTRVGLIFVPSEGGRSHCPEEWTSSRHCYLGTALLAETLREIAY